MPASGPTLALMRRHVLYNSFEQLCDLWEILCTLHNSVCLWKQTPCRHAGGCPVCGLNALLNPAIVTYTGLLSMLFQHEPCVDTLEDARFVGSQFVKGEPHVRFYAGAPLVSNKFALDSLLEAGAIDVGTGCWVWQLVLRRRPPGEQAARQLALCVAAASSLFDAARQLACNGRWWYWHLLGLGFLRAGNARGMRGCAGAPLERAARTACCIAAHSTGAQCAVLVLPVGVASGVARAAANAAAAAAHLSSSPNRYPVMDM